MTPTRQGSFHLFRFAGIDLYLHWSWFLVAAYEVSYRRGSYSSKMGLLWNVLEYLALFSIVLLHEFGHSLACRRVGGEADQIVLWPLGGVAYVNPPPRPGATLWSIAAGPLVNVILLPIFFGLWFLSQMLNWPVDMPNLHAFIRTVFIINFGLLAFNCLPIYPLDGGQIFRCLLWFVVGRARSLMVATVMGFVAAAALLVFVLFSGKGSGFGGDQAWFAILAVFMLINCWGGWVHARMLARTDNAPRHEGLSCPSCGQTPPRGDFWLCGHCKKGFDTFDTNAVCPHCGAVFGVTRCPHCGSMSHIEQWAGPSASPPPVRPSVQSGPPPFPPANV